MPQLDTGETTLHFEVLGSGAPVTVFAHGVASSVEDIRFLGSGVPGTRVFFHFRGHGASATPEEGHERWGYPSAARDLLAVLDHVGAQQCLGVSLGAGAALRVIAEKPARLRRAVLLLPAGLDRLRPPDPDSELAQIARLAEAGDVDGLTVLLTSQLPADVAALRGIDRVMRERAMRSATVGVARAIRALPDHPAIEDRAALAAATTECLVIAHDGDDTHPAHIAREVAAALPSARLEVFDRPWSMLRERAMLRTLVSGFLAQGE